MKYTEYPSDRPEQIKEDADAYAKLREKMREDGRIEETNNRFRNIFELGEKLSKNGTSLSSMGSNIKFSIRRGADSGLFDFTRITIEGQKTHDLVITKDKEGNFYADYHDGKNWRKNPNEPESIKSNQFRAKDATYGIPELKEIETLLIQADNQGNTEIKSAA